MDLLLGLDVGTTATKALAFDNTGRVVASASCSLGLVTPEEGWVEQEPEELWRAVVYTCRAVARQVGPQDRIVALAQSSQGGTTVPVGADGHPTYNAISWMDQRTGKLVQEVKDRWGVEFIRTTTGWPLASGLPLQHILWLKQNRLSEFSATRHFLFVNDFICQRLTGELCMNPSDASITQLFNIERRDWDERLLDTAGIGRAQLSPVHPSACVVGKLTRNASEATGLAEDVLVINGAHDQYCAATGIGVTRPGPVLLSCGTAWVFLAVPENLQAGLDSQMAISCHAVPGRWGAMRSLGGVGKSLEWLIDNVWSSPTTAASRAEQREELLQAINAGVGRSPPGAKGLVYCTFVGGHAGYGPGRGAFSGLVLSHSRDDLARAVMEGIAFELRWAIEESNRAGVHVSELRMVGGAAKSPTWPQIIADVTGLPVSLQQLQEAASRGAAILAGVGVGLFRDPQAGLAAFGGEERHILPVSDHRALYDDLFRAYKETVEFLGREHKDTNTNILSS